MCTIASLLVTPATRRTNTRAKVRQHAAKGGQRGAEAGVALVNDIDGGQTGEPVNGAGGSINPAGPTSPNLVLTLREHQPTLGGWNLCYLVNRTISRSMDEIAVHE